MTDQDIGFEPWLSWLLSAFLPLVASVFVPNDFRIYGLIAAGALFLMGIGTLVRQEMRKLSRSVGDS